MYISNYDFNDDIVQIIIKLFPNKTVDVFDVSEIIDNSTDFSKYYDKIILSSSMPEMKRQKILGKICITQDYHDIVDFFNINYYEKHVKANKKFDKSILLVSYKDYKWIDKLQIPIAEHCNLKCNRCYHFSNLKFENTWYDVNKYQSDITLLRDMGFMIHEIRLLGGEPLLSANIFDFIEIAKNRFPWTNIKIVTNGLLLLGKDSEYLEKISKLDVIISISLYPPLVKSIEKIEKILKESNIKYEIFRIGDVFKKILTKKRHENSVKIAKECEKCILVYNGIVSRCAPSVFINIFNKRFDYNYPSNDSKKLLDFDSRKALLKHLNQPVGLCDFCTGDSISVGYEWELSTEKIGANDYIE